MKRAQFVMGLAVFLVLVAVSSAFGAYHHQGESDAARFLEAYPAKAGTKLDNCNLCHQGGSYNNRSGETISVGSCQWCHDTYGYDGSGDIAETMNAFGAAYLSAGRNAQAIAAIDEQDSDGDGHTNAAEIAAGTYPGNEADFPGLVTAPFRIYTRDQLEALGDHTQFLLMNTSRSGDFYAEYTGVPMTDLLDDAGMLPGATGLWVYAPDGWGQSHPLNYVEDEDLTDEIRYHVYGNVPGEAYQYPPATYFYDQTADVTANPDSGWCDYSAPSCSGRTHGDPISIDGGLKAIMAYKREGAYLDNGVLNEENKLDGEGPFRVVVPQKYVSAPDQSSTSDDQAVIWPYTEAWDHNAGSCSRSATILKIEPLPAGTTDIDILEAGWAYVDQHKIIIYGAIDGTDSNGNGVLDSEEGASTEEDMDSDGTPDYMDTDTAAFRHPYGLVNVRMHTSEGNFSNVSCVKDDDPIISQTGKPAMDFPYGVNKFMITGLEAGGTAEVSIEFPDAVSTDAKYYFVDGSGQWNEIAASSKAGAVISFSLTDGDVITDDDGIADGVIEVSGALAIGATATDTSTDDSGGSSSGCFITTLTGR